jgi:hypothetical protein
MAHDLPANARSAFVARESRYTPRIKRGGLFPEHALTLLRGFARENSDFEIFLSAK